MDLGVIKKEEKPTMTASLLCTWICEIQWPEGIIGEITGLEAIRVEKQRRQWQPTPVLLPGKSHGWRSLVGCSPRGRKESDTTERLHFHFDALEKEMATHSSVLAWEMPWTEEPGGLWSIGLQRIRCDWVRTYPLTNTLSPLRSKFIICQIMTVHFYLSALILFQWTQKQIHFQR